MIIDGNDTSKTISMDSIHKIMESFDFKKVHNHMVAINHTWAPDSYPGKSEVPSIEKIKTLCLRLLTETVEEFNPEKPYGNYGTGGFCVYHFPWGMELVYMYEYKRTY